MISPITHHSAPLASVGQALEELERKPGRGTTAQLFMPNGRMIPNCKEHLSQMWSALASLTHRPYLSPKSSVQEYTAQINALESLLKLIESLPDECRDLSGKTDQLKLMAAQALAKLAGIREKFQNGPTPGAAERGQIRHDLNGFQQSISQAAGQIAQQPSHPPALEIAAKLGLMIEVLFGVLLGAAGLQTN